MTTTDASGTAAAAGFSRCPQCGAALQCEMVRRAALTEAVAAPSKHHGSPNADPPKTAVSRECWCARLPHVMAVPPAAGKAACLCPSCLQKLVDAQPAGTP